jgi:hypothetical protein
VRTIAPFGMPDVYTAMYAAAFARRRAAAGVGNVQSVPLAR